MAVEVQGPTGIVKSIGNSSTTPLGAGETFTGLYEDVSRFQEISVAIADGTGDAVLFFDFSTDGINTIVAVPIVISNISTTPPQILRIIQPFFRLRFVNGGTPTGVFSITTIYHFTSATRLTRYLNDVIRNDEPIENVRAFIGGKRPDGTFGNVPLDHENDLRTQVADVGPLAEDRILGSDKATFGAAIVGERLTQVKAQFDIPISKQAVNVEVSGGGSVTQSNSLVNVSTGTAATASAALTSRSRIIYEPGHEIYAIFTAAFTSPTNPDSDQRIGLFNEDDGFFIGYRGLNFGITKRSSGADTFIPQADFNIDTLVGAPESRFLRGTAPEAIDPTLINVYRIRFGWLGSAPVQFEVLSPNGPWVAFNTIRQPNTSILPSIGNPNLPLKSEVTKTLADATDLNISTGSWNAGIVTSPSEKPIGDISLVNSTTTPIAANATYTGQWESTLRYTVVLINSQTSGPTTTGGWQIQWSMDGLNLFFSQSLSQTGNARSLSLSIRAPFFRFVFISGPVAQTVFNIQTMFFATSDALVTQMLNQAVNENTAVPTMRSFMAVKDSEVATDPPFRNLTGASYSAPPGGSPIYAQHVVGPPATSYVHIATNTTTTCKVGAGRLRSISINKAGVGNNTTTVSDGAAVIAVLDSSTTPRQVAFDVSFTTELTVVTAGGIAPDVTVMFD